MNKYNLIDILTTEVKFEDKTYKFNGIQIPMIQRDYAHGRVGETEIRKRFLKAIFNALENNKALELDFVYGAKKSIDSKDFFIPLDGQQRLTTLYLLNWYIGSKELQNDELKLLREALKCFSYATRSSSNMFCEKLSDITISFNELPSIEIKNSSWFFDSLSLDPTIQSMLVMLDDIHIAYGVKKRELFENLKQIRFYILPLDGFDLTDELYIKMNARGKQLTQYENFKADLIKWIKDPNNPFKDDFNQEACYYERTVKYYLFFELKLDNDWTHLFWRFSKKYEELKKKLVDSYIMQFWNRYLLNSYILNFNSTQSSLEDDNLFKTLYGNEGEDSKIKYNSFDHYRAILTTDNKIKDIEKVLDNLAMHFEDISEAIKPNWENNNKWHLFSESINQRQRIILFATTIYLETNFFDALKFKNWMRVVWNIVNDPNIRSVPAMVGAMKFVNELAKYSKDINTFLINPEYNSILGSNNFQIQLEEEHIKSILISKSLEWERLIIEAESHPLFQGNIRFLLADNENTNYEYFEKIKTASFAILSNNDLSDKPSNYLWIRALLAKSTDIQLPITLSNFRSSHWRYLINSSLMTAMRSLIDEVSSKSIPAEECLNDICAKYQRDYSQTWVYPLVHWIGKNGETLLGNYSSTKIIQKYNNYGNDPEHVYLYNRTRWTDGNIILSNFRNEIVRAILKCSGDIIFPTEWHNIQNHYFRGWTIELMRQTDGIKFVYSLDREYVRVGIKENEETIQRFKDIIFNEDKRANSWICRRKYNYKDISSSEDVTELILKIEVEIFDKTNPESLLSQINASILVD